MREQLEKWAASVGNRAPDDRRNDERTCFSFAKSDDDVGFQRAMREQLEKWAASVGNRARPTTADS